MTEKIDCFDGEFAFLSNFYPAEVEFEGLRYPTSEHAFQAAKTLDQKIRREFITECETPGKAKRKGNKLCLRPDWENIKLDIMTTIVRNKFYTNPELAEKLQATGDAILIEGTTWHDTFWGIDLKTGEGENHLGQILMKIRDELKNKEG